MKVFPVRTADQPGQQEDIKYKKVLDALWDLPRVQMALDESGLYLPLEKYESTKLVSTLTISSLEQSRGRFICARFLEDRMRASILFDSVEGRIYTIFSDTREAVNRVYKRLDLALEELQEPQGHESFKFNSASIPPTPQEVKYMAPFIVERFPDDVQEKLAQNFNGIVRCEWATYHVNFWSRKDQKRNFWEPFLAIINVTKNTWATFNLHTGERYAFTPHGKHVLPNLLTTFSSFSNQDLLLFGSALQKKRVSTF